MKALKLVLLTFFLFPFYSFAGNNSLNGTVKDAHGVPLINAVVELSDLQKGTVTDLNGHYSITDLPKGTFVVEAHLIGYATLSKEVLISGSTTLDIQLSETILEKNEVVVTGTTLATEENKSLTPIQSISLKEMQENASSNIIDALATLPGVSEITTGPAVSKPVIRGLSYNRIITLNDGVRQEGQQWGDEHGIEIDDYNVTRAEVLKGPASLAYGSDALAGVVNIISDVTTPEGKIVGNVTGNYQSNDGEGALHAHVNGNENGVTWGAYGTIKGAHDYQNKYDGYVYDTRFQNVDYGANIGLNKKWGLSQLTYTEFNQRLGIPEGDRDTVLGPDLGKFVTATGSVATPAEDKSYGMVISYQHIDHKKLVWNNELYLNNGGRLGLTLGYQNNQRKEFGDTEAFNTPGLSLLLQTYTYDLKYYFPDWKDWKTTAGINGMQQQNQNKGSEYLIPGYNLFDIGAYAITSREWKKWVVSGGLRYDFRTISTQELDIEDQGSMVPLFKPFTRNFSNVSGSIGTGYNINEKTILKFNIASGYRAPNIAELSANGVHEGTVRYENGNTSLKAENSIQTDLGLSWSSQHVMVNFSVFDNYVRNFIYIRKLLSVVNGSDSIPTFNNAEGYDAFIYNQANANLYGAEANIDFHPHPLDWLHLENTISYVRGKLVNSVDGTNNLPYMPPARWLIELRAQKKTLNEWLKNGYVKAGIDINFAQENVFTAYNTETTVPGYTLLDAGIGADVTDRKHKTICTITLAGQNLTNVAYQNMLSRLRYAPENDATGRMGIYNMGRNFSLTVSVPLDIK